MLLTFRSATRVGNILFSGEAYFHVKGYMNSQNYFHWNVCSPKQMHEESLHKPEVIVCCAISTSIVIHRYFQ